MHIAYIMTSSKSSMDTVQSLLGGWLTCISEVVGHVTCTEEMRNVYTYSVGKPKGKILLERRRRRWKDVKMDVREIGCEHVDWIRWLRMFF